MAWLTRARARASCSAGSKAAHLYVGALPGIIMALALVSITVRVALPLYQTAATLIFAYALMFLPRALVGLRSSMAQAPVELERAAMSLGQAAAGGDDADDDAARGAGRCGEPRAGARWASATS